MAVREMMVKVPKAGRWAGTLLCFRLARSGDFDRLLGSLERGLPVRSYICLRSVSDGSGICMGFPPEDDYSFGFISFRAMEVFFRPLRTCV